MRGLGLLAVAACGLAVAAPIPKDKPKKDEDAIQGVWQLEKFEGEDRLTAAEIAGTRYVFEDGLLAVKVDGKRSENPDKYKLDPTAKPKAIDFANFLCTSHGIYELNGDVLKICVVEGPDSVRPTGMKSEGHRLHLLTLKRVKEDKKEK